MPRRKRSANKQQPSLLVVAGIAVLLVAVFISRSGSSAPKSAQSTADSLESQLDAALREKRPTFVFLHSLDCIPCKEMMETVAAVYPEFQDAVVLIDVDIYDPINENILRRENLQSIPTLVFYDGNGKRQIFIGAMKPEPFRQTLTQLAATVK